MQEIVQCKFIWLPRYLQFLQFKRTIKDSTFSNFATIFEALFKPVYILKTFFLKIPTWYLRGLWNIEHFLGYKFAKTDFTQSKSEWNILLHDHFEECIEIANPKGEIFHPKGRSPEEWKIYSRGICNFNASRKMIVQ